MRKPYIIILVVFAVMTIGVALELNSNLISKGLYLIMAKKGFEDTLKEHGYTDEQAKEAFNEFSGSGRVEEAVRRVRLSTVKSDTEYICGLASSVDKSENYSPSTDPAVLERLNSGEFPGRSTVTMNKTAIVLKYEDPEISCTYTCVPNKGKWPEVKASDNNCN